MFAHKPAMWEIAHYDDAAIAACARQTGLSPVAVRVFASRGLTSPQAISRFLEPDLDRDWVATDEIAGMSEAAMRVAEAVRSGERIVVFGDFDLDGISSAALATLGLRAFGAHVEAIVPHRFREGYGLSIDAMKRAVSCAPHLLVTVDCGIANAAEAEWLRSQGVDVVITDHHEPGDAQPQGVPVANPKLAPGGAPLAGAGVALALVRATGELLGQPDVWRDLVDLAALGTIADIVPLTGPNRALVAEGLRSCRRSPRPGLAALASAASVAIEKLSAENVAFALAPRLNAAGRMADPDLALELLMTNDPVRAGEIAKLLDGYNRERQNAESELLDAALAVAERDFAPEDRVLVVAGEGWHEGVRGIVASRLVTRFGVPALVFCIEDGEAQGSGRSIPGIDLYGALADLSPLLTRYGGHEMAVGATLPVENLQTLRQELAKRFSELPDAVFSPRLTVDAEMRLDELSLDLAAELALLEPFGCANPKPLLAVRGVFMTKRALVGRANEHFSFTAYDGVAAVPAIAFRRSDAAELTERDTAVDIAFELDSDEWRGVRRVRMLARDILLRTEPDNGVAPGLVKDLFDHAEEILAHGDYDGIEEAEQFNTKLVGVTFDGRQGALERLEPGAPLHLVRESDNVHDTNACALFDVAGHQVGYFNRRLAAVLAPVLDAGVEYDVEVTAVTGGGESENRGVNVLVSRRENDTSDFDMSAAASARRVWLASLGEPVLTHELVGHFIGPYTLHRAQREALEHLAQGRSTLAVMATGRGKSLIFQIHAAREAIVAQKASIFLYPLRALIADQAFYLEERFEAIGCTVATLTGESSPGHRDSVFAALADGSLDVVLTTPEFFECHFSRFAQTARIGFVVVDEAHHAGSLGGGYRPAYERLGSLIGALRAMQADHADAGICAMPVVLAVTATAPPAVAQAIRANLGVTAEVVDPTVRKNLRIIDERESKDRDARVCALAARGEKMIIYVNSRARAVALARMLRTRVPDLLNRVAFYTAAITREARHAVERAFREGEISCVVATTAFGEGVNMPDVRHVVLYHLPMDEIEFNQLCGRCGRDGKPAYVHLLFGKKDAELNRMILSANAPSRTELAVLYLTLRDCAADSGGTFEISNTELAERASRRRAGVSLTDKSVSAGLSIFRELGLVTSRGIGAYRELTVLPAPETKLDLASSVRYAEGLRQKAAFEAFCERALQASAKELLSSFNQPILPTQQSILHEEEPGALM